MTNGNFNFTGIINAVAGSTPGTRVVCFGTIIALAATVSTSVTEPSPYVQLPAIALGGLVIFAGVFLIFYRGMKENQQSNQRKESRPSIEPSERLQKFCAEVLSTPKTRKEIAESVFSGYANLTKPQLHALVMQSTAWECMLTGLARYDGEKFIDRDATMDPTVYKIGGG